MAVAEVVDRETGELTERDDFGEVRIPREYVISQQGRDYVLSDGLIVGLHQLSHGYFDVETRLEQLPSEANGMLAVCSARVTVFAPDDRERVLRMATGIGDASAQSVGRLIGPHIVRMAETRAVCRALRTLLGKGMTAFEELGPEPRSDGDGEVSRGAPASAPEGILVEGRRFSRPEVVLTKRSRVEACQEAGIPMPVPIPADEAPLREQVGFSQRLRELLLQQRRASPQGAHAK